MLETLKKPARSEARKTAVERSRDFAYKELCSAFNAVLNAARIGVLASALAVVPQTQSVVAEEKDNRAPNNSLATSLTYEVANSFNTPYGSNVPPYIASEISLNKGFKSFFVKLGHFALAEGDYTSVVHDGFKARLGVRDLGIVSGASLDYNDFWQTLNLAVETTHFALKAAHAFNQTDFKNGYDNLSISMNLPVLDSLLFNSSAKVVFIDGQTLFNAELNFLNETQLRVSIFRCL